jgi:D-alanyl-D-alanine carboxypeptidase
MKKLIISLIIVLSFIVSIVKVEAVDNSSYILLDVSSGRVLYEKNKDKRFLTASIAKIMTCMVAIEYGNLFEQYVVDYETITTEEMQYCYECYKIVKLIHFTHKEKK